MEDTLMPMLVWYLNNELGGKIVKKDCVHTLEYGLTPLLIGMPLLRQVD